MLELIEKFMSFYLENAPKGLATKQWGMFVGIALVGLFSQLLVKLFHLPFKSIKDNKKRSKYFALTSAILLPSLLLFFLNPNSERSYTVFGACIFLGIFIWSISKLPDWFPNAGFLSSFREDLSLKEGDRKDSDVKNCPGCNKRTIVKTNAANTPQTCGECGVKVKVLKNKISEYHLLFILFFFAGAVFYFVYLKELSFKEAGYYLTGISFFFVFGYLFLISKFYEFVIVETSKEAPKD